MLLNAKSLLRRAADLLGLNDVEHAERRQLEDTLRRQTELTEAIARNSTPALFLTDARGYCTFMNPAAEDLFGWTFAEICSRPLHEQIHHHRPDGTDYPRNECPIERAMRENSCLRDHEDVLVRRNGEFVPVMVTAKPVSRDGKPFSTVIEIRDLTERKRVEDTLRYQSALLETLVNRAPIGVYMVDELFRIREVNPVAEELFRGIPGGVVGRNFDAVMHILWEKDYADNVVRTFRHTLATGEPHMDPEVAEFRADRKVTVYYEWRLDRITLPDGSHGLVCYFRDISQQVRARLRVAESEERFRLLITVTTDVPWTSDATGAFMTHQPSWEAYTGQDWDQHRGFGWTNTLHPDERDAVIRRWHDAREARQWYETRGRLWHEPSRSYRHVIVRAAPLLYPDGTVREWVGSCTDVEEQSRLAEERQAIIECERAARAAAEHAGRMKDEFLATLSHELRTPLNAILGYATLMLRIEMNDVEAKKAARTIERNARVQAQLIEDLLDMNRIISGKVRLDRKRLNISDVIEEAIRTVGPTAEAKGVRLEVAPDGLVEAVHGDAARIQQVIWNLLANAVSFTPSGGSVRVSFEQVHSRIEIVVTDTGSGISADFLPYVFDRFRQADGSTTRRHGGLGLGLAIAKQLVDLHGGTIRATSPGVGLGASFTVCLPVSVAHPADGEAEEDRPAKEFRVPVLDGRDVDLTGVRVLAVDDEPDTTHLLKRVLEENRAEVVEAASAAEAVAALSTSSFDVLVSDIGMPNEDGFQLIRRVRALDNPNKDIPALALTAFARSEDRRRTAIAGFQTHLAKPVEAPELLAIVANLAGRTGRSRAAPRTPAELATV